MQESILDVVSSASQIDLRDGAFALLNLGAESSKLKTPLGSDSGDQEWGP